MNTVQASDTFVKVWENVVIKEVNNILEANPELTQLETRAKVTEELHNNFSEYDGEYDILVTPKGEDEIQVIVTLAPYGSNPEFKIKPRFKVPYLS